MTAYMDRLLAFQARPSWVAESNELLNALPFSLVGKHVLDFGCGPGALSLMLAERKAHVTALDRDVELLCCAKREAEGRRVRIDFRHTAGDCLPFRHARFDLVVASHVLAHVPVIDRTLCELHRVTVPGGVLAVINPNRWNWLLRVPSNVMRGYRSDPTAKWAFTARGLSRDAEGHGWSCMTAWHTGERLGLLPRIDMFRSRFCLLLQRE